GVLTEFSPEPAAVVPTAGCTVCATLVQDSDIGCYPLAADTAGSRRELHTEMLSLNMCGPTMDSHVVCYLAGQPAADALAGRLPGGANYRNSFGEVYSLDPTGNPALDFPATSFWAVRGVVTITPAPPGTSGVFFSKTPVLMTFSPIATL